MDARSSFILRNNKWKHNSETLARRFSITQLLEDSASEMKLVDKIWNAAPSASIWKCMIWCLHGVTYTPNRATFLYRIGAFIKTKSDVKKKNAWGLQNLTPLYPPLHQVFLFHLSRTNKSRHMQIKTWKQNYSQGQRTLSITDKTAPLHPNAGLCLLSGTKTKSRRRIKLLYQTITTKPYTGPGYQSIKPPRTEQE